MTSQEEAFSILRKWRDESAQLEYSDVIPWENSKGETFTIANGQRPTRIVDVSPGSVILRVDESPETRELELLGATFEYGDARESPFRDLPSEQYVCWLEIELADGRLIVFAERSE